jgi:hypothetical protein
MRIAMWLPTQLWQSLTWDRRKELSGHSRFTIESEVKVFLQTLAVHGSVARTRTRTDCYANTSQRAQTYLGGLSKSLTPLH